MALTLAQVFMQAQARVKAAPMDLAARSSLWQVFAVRGEWERALAQLDMMLRLDASWALEVQGCHALIDAERLRSEVFAGRKPPVFLGPPPSWSGELVAGVDCVARGDRAAAQRHFARVLEDAQPRAGVLNGAAFEWICDADARLGPCLEVVAQGRYVWIEFGSIRRVVCEPPAELRDVVWQPAKLEVDDTGSLDVFLPSRYPGAQTDEHRLARQTDWEDLGANVYLGQGQKCLSTDAAMCGLLDVRELRLGH